MQSKPQDIQIIRKMFVRNNSLTLFASAVPVIFSVIWAPVILSAYKIFLISVASGIYFFATSMYMMGKNDLTHLTWFLSLPLVVYCSADSVNNLNWSEAEKNANWIAYLFAYFFMIALFYRVFGYACGLGRK